MRQIVILSSSPIYTILSLYNLFSTLPFLLSSRSYTLTLQLRESSLHLRESSLPLRRFPIRLSPRHAHRLPSPAHSVFSCAVEGLYPHAPRVGMLACVPLYCALIVHTLSSLVLSKHTTITVQSDSAIEPIALLSGAGSACCLAGTV